MSVFESSHSASLMDYFQDLEDPRMDRRKDHPLINILFIAICFIAICFIAICAVLSGAEGWKSIAWKSIETFGQAKQDWLARYLKLPEGPRPVPSDDTFRRTTRFAGRHVSPDDRSARSGGL